MESLAYLVVVLMGIMLVSSVASGFIGWRAQGNGLRVVALALGTPGLVAGVLLIASVHSVGAVIYGLLGMLGVALTVHRWVRSSRG